MSTQNKKLFMVIAHDEKEYLDEIKHHLLTGEGLFSVTTEREPAVYSFSPQKSSMFSMRGASLEPLCSHALVIQCDDAVTVKGDILAAASEVKYNVLEDGVVFCIGEEVFDELSAHHKTTTKKPAGFPEELHLEANCVMLNETSSHKDEIITRLCEVAEEHGFLNDKDEFENAIRKREDIETTGIGDGLAFPHGHTSAVKIPFILVMALKTPVDYSSVDNKPVDLIFMLGYPSNMTTHLRALAWLSRRLLNPAIPPALRAAKDADTIVSTLKDN